LVAAAHATTWYRALDLVGADNRAANAPVCRPRDSSPEFENVEAPNSGRFRARKGFLRAFGK